MNTDTPKSLETQRASAELHSPSTGYVPELDTFRLLAILSVMCIHWLPDSSWINRIQGQLCNGVHLFFVLSGYLITGILLRCRLNVENATATTAFSFRQFYARRFLRIFPVYYFVLILGLFLHYEGMRKGFVWHATYTSNFFYYFRQKFDGPASLFWTLAVEEQFYLIWPLAILTLPKKAIIPFIIAVVLVSIGLRTEALFARSFANILTPQCMSFLAIGSLLAAAESPFCGSAQARRRLLQSFAAIILVLIITVGAVTARIGVHAALSSITVRSINQPMVSFCFACLFAWAAGEMPAGIGALFRWAPLVYLGRISYGLYVYHLFVTFSLLRWTHLLATPMDHRSTSQLATTFAIQFLITLAIASCSWFIFEKPINDLKRFFPYAKRKAPHA